MLAQLRDRPYRLFLVDAGGALVSCAMLWLVFGRLLTTGLPASVYRSLAMIALLFALNSAIQYRTGEPRWPLRLAIVAIANLLYCALTAGLIVYFRDRLTTLEWIYLPAELAVVIALATVELVTSRRYSAR